jgi:uncharacterized RDD family membrane protein YckC
MKNRFLKLRYILSVLIDYSPVWIIVSLPFNDGPVSKTMQYFPLYVLLIIFIMFEDYFFFNASIGKRLMFIKLANLKGGKRITLMNVFIRRILELFYFIWIFVKIDFNSVSGTIIVEGNFKYITEESKSSISIDDKQVLRIHRIRALMIDLLIISPVIIFNLFWNSEIFIIDIERPWLFFIGVFIHFVPVIYFILRDTFSSNQSFGKRILRIKVIGENNEEMTGLQLALRNFLAIFFFPIEVILFLLNKKMISEIITQSKVSSY